MHLKSLFLAMLLTSGAAATAAGEPILQSNVRVVAGSIVVLPGERSEFRDPELGPRAFGSFSAPTVAVTGGGLAFGPGLSCEFGCRPATRTGLSALADLSEGTVTAQGQFGPIQFSAFGLGDTVEGGGSLEFMVARTFVLPDARRRTAVFQSPFMFAGDLGVPGFLPPPTPDGDPVPIFLAFTFSGTGRATGTFALERQADGSALFFFQSLRFDFGAQAPVPEPGSLFLLGAGLAGVVARQKLSQQRMYS